MNLWGTQFSSSQAEPQGPLVAPVPRGHCLFLPEGPHLRPLSWDSLLLGVSSVVSGPSGRVQSALPQATQEGWAVLGTGNACPPETPGSPQNGGTGSRPPRGSLGIRYP